MVEALIHISLEHRDIKLGNGQQNMVLQTQCDICEKYPDLPVLKETTVRRLKNLYKSNLLQPVPPEKPKTDDSDKEDAKATTSNKVEELPRKKTSRPLLIGEKLDA